MNSSYRSFTAKLGVHSVRWALFLSLFPDTWSPAFGFKVGFVLCTEIDTCMRENTRPLLTVKCTQSPWGPGALRKGPPYPNARRKRRLKFLGFSE